MHLTSPMYTRIISFIIYIMYLQDILFTYKYRNVESDIAVQFYAEKRAVIKAETCAYKYIMSLDGNDISNGIRNAQMNIKHLHVLLS